MAQGQITQQKASYAREDYGREMIAQTVKQSTVGLLKKQLASNNERKKILDDDANGKR